jgi:hypothetical protein
MFDLANLNNLRSYDHLHSWEVYRLRETLTTLEGESIAAGVELTYDHAWLNMNTGETKVYFHDASGQEYGFAMQRARIAVFERMGRETRPLTTTSKFATTPPANPEGWALWLKSVDLEDAGKIMAGHTFGDSRTDAEKLMPALRFVHREFPEVGRWMADRADTLFHYWIGGATAGGEAAAMYESVRTSLDEIRAIFGKPPGRDPIPWPPGSKLPEPDVRTLPPPPDPKEWPRWLAASAEMPEAAALMKASRSNDPRTDADTLLTAARALHAKHPGVARWLADRARRFYYSWTAQATSGGEGVAMQGQVRAELDELERMLKR